VSNQCVLIDAETVELLFQEKFPGVLVSRTCLLGTTLIVAKVWQFKLEAQIEKGAAVLLLTQTPRKKTTHTVTIRKKITSDYREIHAFTSDVVQTLAGIAAALLVGIEGDTGELVAEFKGSDDLIWDAIQTED
jgi:hypothetical protein